MYEGRTVYEGRTMYDTQFNMRMQRVRAWYAMCNTSGLGLGLGLWLWLGLGPSG